MNRWWIASLWLALAEAVTILALLVGQHATPKPAQLPNSVEHVCRTEHYLYELQGFFRGILKENPRWASLLKEYPPPSPDDLGCRW